MKVEIFCLCDFASIDAGGKINIIGVFDTILASGVPIIHLTSTLAIKLRFELIEEGAHELRILLMDSDGVKVFDTDGGQINVKLPAGILSATSQATLPLPPLELRNFGEYSLELAVGRLQMHSIPLFVRKQEPPAPPSHPSGPH